jgi:hypothetical protein
MVSSSYLLLTGSRARVLYLGSGVVAVCEGIYFARSAQIANYVWFFLVRSHLQS